MRRLTGFILLIAAFLMLRGEILDSKVLEVIRVLAGFTTIVIAYSLIFLKGKKNESIKKA